MVSKNGPSQLQQRTSQQHRPDCICVCCGPRNRDQRRTAAFNRKLLTNEYQRVGKRIRLRMVLFEVRIFELRLTSLVITNSVDNRIKSNHHNTTTILRPFFRDHPREPVPEENFWTLSCKGRLTEGGRHTDHPAGHHSFRTNQCPPPPSPYFLRIKSKVDKNECKVNLATNMNE